jgi:hypothetical protein
MRLLKPHARGPVRTWGPVRISRSCMTQEGADGPRRKTRAQLDAGVYGALVPVSRCNGDPNGRSIDA